MNYYAPFQRPIDYYNPSIPYQQGATQLHQTVPPMQGIQQSINDLIFVLNETEAMAYPVAPNNTVTLWDKSKDTVYIKSNMQGIPTMRILDYKERNADNAQNLTQNSGNANGCNYVRVDDFKVLQSKFETLQSDLEEIKAKAKKEGANNDE